MATASEPTFGTHAHVEPYPITSDMCFRMVESGLIPEERPVFLWDGILFEKRIAKTCAHFAVQDALCVAIARRLPAGYYVGGENPVQLDERHTPLPDRMVLRGAPLDTLHLGRYPDGREVELDIEIAVTGLLKDTGPRLGRYAAALPRAAYLVADPTNRRVLVYRRPRAEPPGYDEVETVGPGQQLRLSIGGIDLEPIPFEEVLGPGPAGAGAGGL